MSLCIQLNSLSNKAKLQLKFLGVGIYSTNLSSMFFFTQCLVYFCFRCCTFLHNLRFSDINYKNWQVMYYCSFAVFNTVPLFKLCFLPYSLLWNKKRLLTVIESVSLSVCWQFNISILYYANIQMIWNHYFIRVCH
jgi:hypothetical protein